MSDAGYEFERAQPLGRTCDTCGEWLPDAFWSLDQCYETVVAGEHGEPDTTAPGGQPAFAQEPVSESAPTLPNAVSSQR